MLTPRILTPVFVLMFASMACTEPASSDEDVVQLGDVSVADTVSDTPSPDTTSDSEQWDGSDVSVTSCYDLEPGICDNTKGCYWWQSTCNGQPEGMCLQENGPTPGPCQPCAQRFDGESCEGDGTCRWLVPGCAMDPRETFGLPACAPVQDCTPDTVCDPGTFCERVVYDPCWDSTCRACAGEAFICMGQIDG